MTNKAGNQVVDARGWVAWGVASSCLLFQFVVQIQPSAMIKPLEVSLQVDAVELGWLSAAYFLSYLILQVPMGWLLDRFGPRLVLGTSMVLGSIGLIWFGTASTLDSAIAARAGLGVAGAPAFAASALVASREFPASRFALMLGLTEAFTLLGGVAVTLGLPVLDRVVSRGGSGVVLAVISAVLALACFLLVKGRSDPPTPALAPAAHGDGGAPRSVVRTIFNPVVLLAGVHAGLFFSIIAAFGGLWAAPFLRMRLGLEAADASQPVAILFAAGVLGAPLLGLVSGRARWRGPTLLIASFMCAGSAALLIHAPGGAWFVVSFLALLGFFAGVFAVDLAALQDVIEPRRRGLALGTANMMLGVIVGPVVLMLVAESLDRTGTSGSVEVLEASIDQLRVALSWFIGGLVLAIPVGIALLVALRREVLSREPIR